MDFHIDLLGNIFGYLIFIEFVCSILEAVAKQLTPVAVVTYSVMLYSGYNYLESFE